MKVVLMWNLKTIEVWFSTILGNGKQIVSWIHIDDLIRAILFAMENEKMEGVYNAVAPHPVSNKNWCWKLRE
jgi:NAD dependent epimerase/dehydratase family enzyme